MRLNGRRYDELIPIKITSNYTAYVEGSVLIACENNSVLCNVTIQETAPRWMQSQGRTDGCVHYVYQPGRRLCTY
jgi:ribonuclease PH